MPARTLLQALLKAALAALAAVLSDWRRDRALERLGYTRAVLDEATRRAALEERYREIDAADLDLRGAGDLMRAGAERDGTAGR